MASFLGRQAGESQASSRDLHLFIRTSIYQEFTSCQMLFLAQGHSGERHFHKRDVSSLMGFTVLHRI